MTWPEHVEDDVAVAAQHRDAVIGFESRISRDR